MSSHKGNGNEPLYYYNAAGLVEDITMKVDGESFTTRYYYDKYERVMREVRPNGETSSNKVESLALDYLYNPYGYKSAVRSPKAYADDVFNSAEFRSEIKLLIDQALVQADKYLETAARYKQQEQFFTDKAAEYVPETRDVHHLDVSSQALLGEGYFYQQWCSDDGQCDFRPAVWTLIHGAVTVPVPVSITDSDQIYRIESTLDVINRGYVSTAQRCIKSVKVNLMQNI
ncbi:MAG: YD repeat-containing protein [Moritella sp.]